MIAEVSAPAWLHRFIIGKKGVNVRKITQDLPKVGHCLMVCRMANFELDTVPGGSSKC